MLWLLELLLGLELLLRLELLLPLGLLQKRWLDGLLGLLLLSEELLLLLRLESRLGRLSRLAERLSLLEKSSMGRVSWVDEVVEVLASGAGRN